KTSKMPALTLYDDRSGNTYILEVSEEEFTKANKDMLFATRLLQKKLASQPQTVNEPVQTVHELEASTSSCDDNNIHTSTDNKTQQLSDVEEKDSFRWPHEAILLLLTIYKEHENKMTSGKISVKKFWNVVSCQLIDKGYHVTSIQCKNKMAGLKNTSGNSTRTWKYFNVMDEIFNKRPWVTPISTLDSGKRRSALEKMFEENTNIRKKMHEEAMARQDKLLDILSKVLQK
ncbi:uncharacterized protein, partial [Mycetomoellerius zeteki]|uniref:uncharacterized protein n=1 Tax=Mycetomoellerius zeteki TaxID=64791 RepID=UPI00084EB1DC